MSGDGGRGEPGDVTGGTENQDRPEFLSQPVEIPARKGAEYLLNVDHRDGGAQARFFLARGFSAGG
jgi:hypothetical protein